MRSLPLSGICARAATRESPEWECNRFCSVCEEGKRDLWLAKNTDLPSNQADEWCADLALSTCKTGLMLCLLRLLFVLPTEIFGTRRDLLLETLALRQQLAVLKQRYPRPRFAASGKFFWVMLRRLWPRW